MSILQPVRSTIERIILPPGPMMSRILSTGTRIVRMRGANGLISVRGCASASSIRSRMWMRPARACSSAPAMIAGASPSTLMSICSAVMPVRVPATLKSMSP